jgi:hypothetical protein
MSMGADRQLPAGVVVEMFSLADDEAMYDFAVTIAHEIARDTGKQLGVESYLPTIKNNVIVARKDGVPVSFIVWQDWDGDAFIGLAWTARDCRKQGLYAYLVAVLLRIAAAKGLTGVSVGVVGTNHVSMEAHRHIFGSPEVSFFKKRIGN